MVDFISSASKYFYKKNKKSENKEFLEESDIIELPENDMKFDSPNVILFIL